MRKIKYCPLCGATTVLNIEVEAAKKLISVDVLEYACKECKFGGIISIEANYLGDSDAGMEKQ